LSLGGSRDKPTRLFLLRHGETLANIELIYQGQGDSPLSELGVAESELLAKALENEKFAGIYSSTLARSSETANIIAKQSDLNIVKIPELAERYYGVFEGLTFESIKEKYPDIYQLWLTNPDKAIIKDAETLEELQRRGVKAVSNILKKHKGETICIVGHGAINRTILFHYMNLGLDNFWRIKQDNCCINIIEFDKHPMVTLLNSTYFLGEKRVSKISIY
jgi:probable phosphoglycerate mutase